MLSTRRRAVLAALVGAFAPVTGRAENTADPLRRLIDQVINAGNVDDLEDIVHEDVTIPDYDIVGIESFQRASVAAHEQRLDQYSDYAFTIEAICNSDGWSLAYVRFSGITTAGVNEDRAVFYAAEISDGKILNLYF